MARLWVSYGHHLETAKRIEQAGSIIDMRLYGVKYGRNGPFLSAYDSAPVVFPALYVDLR